MKERPVNPTILNYEKILLEYSVKSYRKSKMTTPSTQDFEAAIEWLNAPNAESCNRVAEWLKEHLEFHNMLTKKGISWEIKTAEHKENGYTADCWISWGPHAYKRWLGFGATPIEALKHSYEQLKDKLTI